MQQLMQTLMQKSMQKLIQKPMQNQIGPNGPNRPNGPNWAGPNGPGPMGRAQALRCWRELFEKQRILEQSNMTKTCFWGISTNPGNI